jgi:hypothetical protein
MKKTTKQVYFALVVEVEVAEDGTEKVTGAFIDDERAMATWDKEDVWVTTIGEETEPPDVEAEWCSIYEEPVAYEMAQEALQNAIAVMNKEEN